MTKNIRVLRWVGSKWTMAEKIIETFPKHSIYVEPFFGSGAVLFNREIKEQEVINDIDDEVYNLFSTIRNNPSKLAYLVEMTPYSNKEYSLCLNSPKNAHLSKLEKARRFLVRSNMAIGSEAERKAGWRTNGYVSASKSPQRITNEWNNLPTKILQVANRLKNVEIEHTDVIKVLEKYNYKDVLAYVDPPYILETRKRKYYKHEFTNDDHIRLLDYLVTHYKGKVVISGYDCEIYNSRLKAWNRIEIDATAETGAKRMEVLWFNYEPLGQTRLEL